MQVALDLLLQGAHALLVLRERGAAEHGAVSVLAAAPSSCDE
jgi:hypothetical protein